MTTRSMTRLAAQAAVFLLVTFTAARSPRAAGAGTLAFGFYSYAVCGYGATNGTPPPCPAGLQLSPTDGTNVIQLTSGLTDARPAWSPDGDTIAFSNATGIFTVAAAGGVPLVLTSSGADRAPAWSPDGARIAFASARDGSGWQLYVMNADGSNVTRLNPDVAGVDHPSWAPDGSKLAFDCEVDAGNVDVCVVDADGANLARLTTDPAADNEPAWAPDGTVIAFATMRYGTVFETMYGNGYLDAELAVMNPDGSGLRPLSPGYPGSHPSWSPDGARIAFDALDPNLDDGYYALTVRAVGVMNADGTGILTVGSGFDPAWRPGGGNLAPSAAFNASCAAHTCSFDASPSVDVDGSIAVHAWDFGDGETATGAAVTHTYATGSTITATLTVTDDGGAARSTSHSVTPNASPAAALNVYCSGMTCTFDGRGSIDDGTIVSYAWSFGDGGTGTGVTTTHTYATPGSYRPTLTVTDNEGASGSWTVWADPYLPPVPSFTYACSGLSCAFDGTSSSVPVGTIVFYQWSFGDGPIATFTPTASHTFAAAGTYLVQLVVGDSRNHYAAQTQNVTVTVPPPPPPPPPPVVDSVHVGDLDATSSRQSSSWTAAVTVEVHRLDHTPRAGTTVGGTWSTGATGSCVTASNGRCVATLTKIPNATGTVTFAVKTLSDALPYRSDKNHDPDGDSNGTSVSVKR